jgi:hypothetical protein
MRSRAVTVALIVAMAFPVGVMATVDGPPAGAAVTSGTPPAGTPTAHHFRGVRTVGPLFPPGSRVHSCTASVVASTAGNLLVTSAHCISGTAEGYTFAPGYHDGIEPFGSWTVIGAYGAAGWIAHRDPQRDFSFLVVASQRVDGRTRQLQQVTGANRLGSSPSPGAEVTVPAYAVGSDDEPLTCTARVYRRGQYPAFNCNPYVDGTSGAPWLQRSGKGWLVVGVIGGLHQGGCYPWTSYTAAFGTATARSYASAARRAKASVFPPPDSDGCSTGL